MAVFVWLCVYVCVTLHALVYGAARCLHWELGACVPEPEPVCLSLLQLLDQELQHELLAHNPAAHPLRHWGE